MSGVLRYRTLSSSFFPVLAVPHDRVPVSRGTSSLSLVIILLLPARYLESRSLGAFHTRGRSLDWKTTHTGTLHHRRNARRCCILVNKIPFDRASLPSAPRSLPRCTVPYRRAIYDLRRHAALGTSSNDTRTFFTGYSVK